VRETITGYDRLTGQSVTIDGVTLLRTKFEAQSVYDDGTLVYRVTGNEYIHPEWRMFVSGSGRHDMGDGTFLPYNAEPVSFAFPGEDGFLSTTPLYDCEEVVATAPMLTE
jgi:hypothetical protein